MECKKSIWKFPLKEAKLQSVCMPVGAQILSVQVQQDEICLWALVDTQAPQQSRMIEMILTGEEIIEGNRSFIGTVQRQKGVLIIHVFIRKE